MVWEILELARGLLTLCLLSGFNWHKSQTWECPLGRRRGMREATVYGKRISWTFRQHTDCQLVKTWNSVERWLCMWQITKSYSRHIYEVEHDVRLNLPHTCACADPNDSLKLVAGDELHAPVSILLKSTTLIFSGWGSGISESRFRSFSLAENIFTSLIIQFTSPVQWASAGEAWKISNEWWTRNTSA